MLLKFYKGLFHPHHICCFPIGGSSPSTSVLDAVQREATRVINSPVLTSFLDSLDVHHKVTSRALIHRYFHGSCSKELANFVPTHHSFPWNTREAVLSHSYCISFQSQDRPLCSNPFCILRQVCGVIFCPMSFLIHFMFHHLNEVCYNFSLWTLTDHKLFITQH